jgi:hypothetical protein
MSREPLVLDASVTSGDTLPRTGAMFVLRLSSTLPMLLLLSMLIFQSVMPTLKLLLLIGSFLFILLERLFRSDVNLYIASEFIYFGIFYSIIGLLWTILGLLLNAPGALEMMRVTVVWPLVFVCMMHLVHSARSQLAVLRTILNVSLAICLYGLAYMATKLGLWPATLFYELPLKLSFGAYDGYLELSMTSMTTLFASVPALFAACFIVPKSNSFALRQELLLFALLVSLAFVLISGRRALWLVVGICPFIILFFMLFLPRKELLQTLKDHRWMVIILVLLSSTIAVASSIILQIDWAKVFAIFLQAFDPSSEESAGVRGAQYVALFQEWQTSPLFGRGHGATARDVVRSLESPWAYELSYMALLMQTGIIGILLYSIGGIWIYACGIRIIRSGGISAQLMIITLTALSCFLIANGTNPYLMTFDSLWVIFWPLSVINYVFINEKRKT